jgi:hypothetical protein
MLRGSVVKIIKRLFQAASFIFREQSILQPRDAVQNSQEHLDSTVTVRQQRHGLGNICYFGPNLDRHESSVIHHSERRFTCRPHRQWWPERGRCPAQSGPSEMPSMGTTPHLASSHTDAFCRGIKRRALAQADCIVRYTCRLRLRADPVRPNLCTPNGASSLSGLYSLRLSSRAVRTNHCERTPPGLMMMALKGLLFWTYRVLIASSECSSTLPSELNAFRVGVPL